MTTPITCQQCHAKISRRSNYCPFCGTLVLNPIHPKQVLVWIPAGKAADRVAEVSQAPSRIWTLLFERNAEKKPDLPVIPIHNKNAFLEDHIHDWIWRNGVLRYYSRLNEGGTWALLEYDS